MPYCIWRFQDWFGMGDEDSLEYKRVGEEISTKKEAVEKAIRYIVLVHDKIANDNKIKWCERERIAPYHDKIFIGEEFDVAIGSITNNKTASKELRNYVRSEVLDLEEFMDTIDLHKALILISA